MDPGPEAPGSKLRNGPERPLKADTPSELGPPNGSLPELPPRKYTQG